MVTYEEAKRNPEVRQIYLDGIDLEGAKPFVERVEYRADLAISSIISRLAGAEKVKYLMGVDILPECRRGVKGIKQVISVYPLAFGGWHQTEADFLYSLIDHEGTHAREMYELPDKILPSLERVRIVFMGKKIPISEQLKLLAAEQRAVHAQVEKMVSRACSTGYMKSITELLDNRARAIGRLQEKLRLVV